MKDTAAPKLPHVRGLGARARGALAVHAEQPACAREEVVTGLRRRCSPCAQIPIQPTQLAGVVVERGPDCMYVQVRARGDGRAGSGGAEPEGSLRARWHRSSSAAAPPQRGTRRGRRRCRQGGRRGAAGRDASLSRASSLPVSLAALQVKCRDRKGLLVDIINALKQLPLEVRTIGVLERPRRAFPPCSAMEPAVPGPATPQLRSSSQRAQRSTALGGTRPER